MSAAEALYLPGENTESSYKIGLRAAFFVEVENVARRAVFRTMRAAYNIRSKVAHGSAPKKERRPSLDGVDLTPAQFVDLIDELVAKGIVRAVREGVPQAISRSLTSPVVGGRDLKTR